VHLTQSSLPRCFRFRKADRPTDRSYASWSSSPHLTASHHRPAQRSCTCSKTAPRATAAAPRSRSRHCNRNQHATDSAGTHRKAPEIVPDNQPAGERPKRAHTRALLVIERPQSRAACRSAASIDERHASSGASRGAGTREGGALSRRAPTSRRLLRLQGVFALKMSNVIFVEPSACGSCTTTYFPTCVTPSAPSGSIPSV
jgi:hypothetical protein